MIVDTDVLISNFSVGTLDGWGLSYDELAAINPRLIWTAGNTFGPLGTDSKREGADLAAQCAGGLATTTGRDGDPPSSPVGVTSADHIASLNMVCGVLSALHTRATTGRGQKVEVSLLGSQIWAQASEYTHYLMTGNVPGRSNYGHPLLRGAYRLYATKDGWIGLIGVPPQAVDELLVALEREDMLADERMATLATDDGRDWFLKQIELPFECKTTVEWCEIFANMPVRYAPVRKYDEVVADANVWENEYLISGTDARGEIQRVVASPIRMSETPLHPALCAPTLGEHTVDILKKLDISTEKIAELHENGVV